MGDMKHVVLLPVYTATTESIIKGAMDEISDIRLRNWIKLKTQEY